MGRSGEQWVLLNNFQGISNAELLVFALKQEGIVAKIQGEYLSSLVGEASSGFPVQVEVLECDFEPARAVLNVQNADVAKADVVCAQCLETSPGTFETCWKCGAGLDDSSGISMHKTLASSPAVLADHNTAAKLGDLICTQCLETSPGTFETCWKCGRHLDDSLHISQRTTSTAIPAILMAQNADVAKADFVCATCLETSPGNFESCWKCGSLLNDA